MQFFNWLTKSVARAIKTGSLFSSGSGSEMFSSFYPNYLCHAYTVYYIKCLLWYCCHSLTKLKLKNSFFQGLKNVSYSKPLLLQV